MNILYQLYYFDFKSRFRVQKLRFDYVAISLKATMLRTVAISLKTRIPLLYAACIDP